MVQASIWKQTKQDPENEQVTFSQVLRKYMAKKKVKTAAALAVISHLPETRISRMLNNDNGRGKHFRPQIEDIWAISLALGIGWAGFTELVLSARPGGPILAESLENGEDVYEANRRLKVKGLPQLGPEENE